MSQEAFALKSVFGHRSENAVEGPAKPVDTYKGLVLLGAGGHAQSVIDVIEQLPTYKILHLMDMPEKRGSKLSGYSIDCTEEEVKSFIQEGSFVITVGQIKFSKTRVRLYEYCQEIGAQLATIVSPLAYVSARSQLGAGTVVLHKSVVNAGVSIGENAIINTGAIVEHGVSIGHHVHLAPGSIVNGDAQISDRCFIGAGAVVLQGVQLAEGTIVGANVCVRHSVVEKNTVVF